MNIRLSQCCRSSLIHHENWDAEFDRIVCKNCGQRCEIITLEDPCTYCGGDGKEGKCLSCGKNYLRDSDLHVGGIYRGKRSRAVTNRMHENFGEHPDREIVYIGGDHVQYDSISVRMGRHLPTMGKWEFLRWAKEEIIPEKK